MRTAAAVQLSFWQPRHVTEREYHGENNIRKGILRSLCAAVTAFAAAAVPVMGGTTFADTKDYDQEIAQLEQKAEQIKKDNEAREQQIGSLKSDVAENEQKMGLLQEQINGINDEVKTYGQLITTQQEKIAERKTRYTLPSRTSNPSRKK